MSDVSASQQRASITDPSQRCPACGIDLPDELRAAAEEGVVVCPRPSCGLQLECSDKADALRPVIRSLRLVNGYSLLVLPFACPAQQRERFEREHARRGRWRRRVYSLDRPEDVDRTEYFMPYARRFLFPTLFESAEEQTRSATCRHYEFDLAHLGAEAGGPLRFTTHFIDRERRLPKWYHASLGRVEMILFHYGVGFLILHVSMESPHDTYIDQMDAARYLRMFAPLFVGFQMPQLLAGDTSYTMPQLLAYLLDEFAPSNARKAPASPAEVPSFQDGRAGRGNRTLDASATSAASVEGAATSAAAVLPVRPIYDDRMLVYWFSCIDQDSRLADAKLCRGLLKGHSVIGFGRDMDPPGDLSDPDGASTAWLRQRWQCCTKDGGGLVVFNTDRYQERYLGLYHGTYYFDIFILAALQRATLLNLFERLSDIPALTEGGTQSQSTLRRVRKDLLMFKNQCWFSQITNRERGLQLWKTWQETFENRTLLDEVNDQAEELDSYLRARTRERVEWLVRLGGFLAVAVPAVLGIDVLLGKAGWVEQLKWILLAVLALGCGIFAWVMLSRGRDD